MTKLSRLLLYLPARNGRRIHSMARRLIAVVFFCAASLLCYAADSFSADTVTVITSDTLEYSGQTRQYVATGSVKIVQEDTVITADEITFDETTSDVVAQGNVDYRDSESSVQAVKAEMNMERKTGTLYDANLLYVADNYHLTGKVIEMRGEKSFYSPEAVFTTCDAPVPAWCFKAKNVDLVTDESLKAKDASFRIKDLPVLYTPYLRTPIHAARETGFLIPVVSNSNTRGLGLGIPFYWAIAENRDATVLLDIYTKRGIGEGLEYRFVEPGGVKGYGWAYHIRDTETNKDFLELKGLYDNRPVEGPGGFLNVNYLNEKEFYRTFSTHLQARTQRFLESTGEVNLPLENSRAYLLSQYWVDLKAGSAPVAQKLPEVGYVLNYRNIGGTLFSGSLTADNLWRDGGLSAGRIDLYPKLLHSFGTDVVVSQTAALRATSYSFYKDDVPDDNPLRTALEYDVVAHTSLYRKYDAFLHVIEPSVRYHFISSSENDLPVFDSTELFKKTSVFELSLLNRLIVSGNEVATMRITQQLDADNSDQRPLRLELGMNRWLPMKLDATYNFHTGQFEIITSELGLSVFGAGVSLGQSYNRAENLMLYRAGIAYSPRKNINVSGSLWYDAKGGGLRDMNITIKYQRQCWGLNFQAIKRPGDFTMMVMVELKGLNMKPLKD